MTTHCGKHAESHPRCADCHRLRMLDTARATIATLEARIAELTREREDWRKRPARTMCGPNCAHCLYQDERGRAAAARAERDEAVGLLRDDAWPMLVGNTTPESIVAQRLPGVSTLGRIAAYLARLAAAPGKEMP